MSKRFDWITLMVFAILAVGLGVWGYARAGSDFSPASGSPRFERSHSYPHFRCVRCSALPACPTPQPANPSAPSPAPEKCDPNCDPLCGAWMELLRCLFCSIALIRLYDLFQPGQAPWQLVIAQFLVPGIAAVSALQLFLAGVRKNFRTAMARRKTDHSIVCGIGDVGMQIVQNLHADGHDVVAVDLEGESASAATCEKSGVPVLQGDAKNPQVLLAAGIRRAQNAIVCTGSDSENIDIALQIKSIDSHPAHLKQSRIRVLVQVRDDWMHKRLLASDKSTVDLSLFNPYTSAARLLVRCLRLPPIPEFEAQTFVLIGFGAYGREIAQHLIQLSPVALGQTLKIVIFDKEAIAANAKFAITDPVAAKMAELDFATASIEPGSPDLANIVQPKLESAGSLLGVALALGDDKASLSAALEVRSLLDRMGQLHVPIYVRLEHYLRFGELVRDIESISSFRDRLQIFGTLEETLNSDVLFGSKLDAFASALHEDYRLQAQGAINPQADRPFHELPEFLKMSNRWRADHTPLLMELAGLHLVHDVRSPSIAELTPDQIELLAELEHRRYSIERRIVESRFGFANQESPHMKPWKELGDDYKNWNRKQIAHLPEIMARLGIELHPIRAVCLYGEGLAAAAAELEKFIAEPSNAFYSLRVDLDDLDAVRAAVRALSLPSFSLWLFSNEEPPEFALRKPPKTPTSMYSLIQRANGWSLRGRVALDA